MTPAPSPRERLSRPHWVVAPADGDRTVRWLGVILVVLQAVILGYLSGARLFPVVAIGLAIGFGATRRRLWLEPITVQLVAAVIAIGFLLSLKLSPFSFPEEALSYHTPLAHAVARALIGMQILSLILYHESGRLPVWLVGLGAMCLPFATNVQVPGSLIQAPGTVHRPLLLLIVTFVAVAALYSSFARQAVTTASKPQRGTRTSLLAALLVVAMFLGGGTAVALVQYERKLEWWLRDYLGNAAATARGGFSPNGRLNDILAWKTLGSERIAIRVFADRQPGYLRGKALDTYRSPRWEHSWRAWSTHLPMEVVPPAGADRQRPVRGPGKFTFVLDGAARSPWRSVDVWPEPQLGQYLFAPLEAADLAVNRETVRRDGHGNLMADEHDRPLRYSFLVPESPSPAPLSPDMRELLTAVDPEVEPFVRNLADRLFTDCQTAREKMDRVRLWFRSNFKYHLGIRIPRGMDPLAYFLRERPPAHCEFFATGTAVLLRLAGVPCRYVTGYVAAEENAVGGYWVARNKDAHAWVEAYDDETRQWVIVESTPAAGVPAQRTVAVRSQLTDSLHQHWTMITEALRAMGIGGLLRAIARKLGAIPGLVILMLGIGGMLLWKAPPLPRFRFRRTERRLRGLHAVLKQLDRRAKRHGLVRNPNETVLQFADRLRCAEADPRWRQEMAGCYDLYATLRFRSQTGSDAIERLRQAIAGIRRE